MKVLFDLQALQNESRNRGIGRYVKSLFDALARRSDIALYGLLNGAMHDTLGPAMAHAAAKIGEQRVFVFPGLAETSEHISENRGRRLLGEAAYETFVASIGCDVLLAGSVVEGFGDDTCLSLRARDAQYLKAVVLYDLIPLIEPDKYLGCSKTKAWYSERIRQIEAADLSLAISASSRGEALTYLETPPDRSVAISTAIDATLFRPEGSDSAGILARLNITKPFVMHASAIEPRKNFDGLVKAFAALPAGVRDKHQLVLVGKASPEMSAYLQGVAHAAGVPEGDLIMPGFVPDDDLARLYRSCRLFVFPSLHEGFGLPALEAMACGCPTIGSNSTSLPEVIGNSRLTFDPSDTAAMSDLMLRLLTDVGVWRRARAHALRHAATFSWDGVAERAIDALRANLAGRAPAGPPAFPSAQRMADRIGNRIDLKDFHQGDLAALARCLVGAEDELVTKLAAAVPKKRKTWRIEGPFDSTYSLALVNRETARALSDLGWQVALHSTEGPGDFTANPYFLAENPDLAVFHDLAAKSDHRRSFAVSRMLYPPRVTDMNGSINALHHYAWEETGFPQAWADDFNASLTMMTTLSRHVEKVMVDNGISVPMVTSGCGVDHWDRVVPDADFEVTARSFRFLHVSSCFPRKGVDAMLEAYEAAFTIDDDVSLIIKTFENPHNDVKELIATRQSRNGRFPNVVLNVGDLTDAQLKSLYSQCDVMVGPSHAEGYGLPFAEAMLSGIPVITTNWGGQLDFCNTGNSWLVDYRFERANSHFGLWASAWARVDIQALAQALKKSHEASPETRAAMAARGREQLLARHQWSHVAQRLTAAAAILPQTSPHDPRIGWITTWHSKCGIATYSKHLIDALPGNIAVFSPENEARLAGRDHSKRVWRLSKSRSRLDRVLDHADAKAINVFIIQFNFGFYNHADLTNFIARAKDQGKTVLICLHSTVFPLEVPDPENYQLAWLAPALAECDRVLVHSIDDLNRLKDLNLIDNVALFPHGALRRKDEIAPRSKADVPTIATYGFALPHKGLPELLEAARLLHDSGRQIRLRMVNAEYPVPVSAELIDQLKQKIHQFSLAEWVELHTQFLPDDKSLDLLIDSDLLVFPYQDTAESASGAVRYGMAAARPVAVTPLDIFADLKGATFRMAGTSPTDLASGIATALDAIAGNTQDAVAIAEKAERWRHQHNYDVIARRLFNLCKALANR